MPSFRNIIADKKYAKKGETTPVKKIGGLTIDFSAQSFSQEYLDSFLEHIEQEKIIERFSSIYLGEQANTTEKKAADHFVTEKRYFAETKGFRRAGKNVKSEEHINKQNYEAIIFWHRRLTTRP